YRERNTAFAKSRSRAYYLFQNTNRVAARQRPDFVKTPTALQTIFVRDTASPIADPPPSSGYCAQMTANFGEFELFRDGVSVGRFNLPAYRAYSNPDAVRFFLSPVAVILDAAGMLLVGWFQAGGPGLASTCGG